MLNWLRRRRLSAESRRRLLIHAARSEEAIIETHVENATALLDALGDEVDLDHALELYDEMMSLHPSLAATVKTRVLARLDPPSPHRSGLQGICSSPRPKRKPREH
jgi:pentatricopeptide repeat protein